MGNALLPLRTVWWQDQKVKADLKVGFLAASPNLSCPFFHRALVLLVDHREDGSLGFVVNKESDMSFREILSEVGIEAAGSSGQEPLVHTGGPVSPDTGWLVFDSAFVGEKNDEGVVALENGFAVSANLDLLKLIAEGEGPESYLMMLGYAGWGPGQLDDEIRQGSWIPVDVDVKTLFDTPIADRWEASLASLGIDPRRMSATNVADA